MTSVAVTLSGTVRLDKEGLASCWFEWGTTKAFGERAPCEPEEVTAEEQAVHARLEDLHPGTTYFYRLEARNKNGTNAGEDSQDRSFTTTGPNIEHESVLGVTGTTASFDATIFPNHAPTSYYVQYSTADTSGCEATVSISSCPTVPALPGEAIGAGVEPVTTPSQAVTGLSPATLYHYRVIALSELQPGQQTVFEGPDETFTTQGAGAFTLPDHRQWEMVYPPGQARRVDQPDRPGRLGAGRCGRGRGHL